MFGKASPRQIDAHGVTADAADCARVEEQLRFLRQQRLVAFGWIGFTSALAIIHPFGGPDALGFMIMAFVCTVMGPVAFAVAWPMLFLVSNTAVGVLGGSGPGVEAFFRFPESFIPMFGVPFMACLHLIALMQIRGGRMPNRAPLFRNAEPAVGYARRP